MIYLQIYIIYDDIFIWKNLLFNGYCHSLLVQYWLRVLQRLDKGVIVGMMEMNQIDLKKYVVRIHYIQILLHVISVQMVQQISQSVHLLVQMVHEIIHFVLFVWPHHLGHHQIADVH